MRQMVVVGSKQMVQYEDTSADASVRIYDRGMDFSEPPANFGEYRLTYRTGDMVAPQIEPAEPLSLELQDFASAILEGTTPVSSSRLGLEVVLALQALERSLESRGEPVAVPSVEQILRRRAARGGHGPQSRRVGQPDDTPQGEPLRRRRERCERKSSSAR